MLKLAEKQWQQITSCFKLIFKTTGETETEEISFKTFRKVCFVSVLQKKVWRQQNFFCNGQKRQICFSEYNFIYNGMLGRVLKDLHFVKYFQQSTISYELYWKKQPVYKLKMLHMLFYVLYFCWYAHHVCVTHDLSISSYFIINLGIGSYYKRNLGRLVELRVV